ncbi:MAG: hypothetical protein H6841_00205 [Planctomycetes bacterium]|nr:hypothetical protein [Planctomycetota bacterium]
MQPNPQRPTPRRPVGQRPQGNRQAAPNIPRNDLPPGMGGGEPTGEPRGISDRPLYSGGSYNSPPPQVGSLNAKAWGGMGLGLLLIVGGVGATMYSYNSPGADGKFTVWWGPVLFGVITFFGGVAALFKK